jgi:hypothetical protein
MEATMKKVAYWVFLTGFWLWMPHVIYGQQAEAPTYKDGDWWKIKVEVVHKEYSRSGQCDELYSEYVVRWEQGAPKVYGISEKGETGIDCPSVARDLLNVPPDAMSWVKFPLAPDSNWTFRYQRKSPGPRRLWVNTENKVKAWEKVTTPKGELEAFKIQRTVAGDPDSLYSVWYSPAAKAIIFFKRAARLSDRTVTLVDFNVSL